MIDGSVVAYERLFVFVIVVMLNVMLCSFLGMVCGMYAVAVRQMGMVRSLFVMTNLVVLGGFAMMLGGALMMLCGSLVMFFVFFVSHRFLPLQRTWARTLMNLSVTIMTAFGK
jgi:hypothetical protein